MFVSPDIANAQGNTWAGESIAQIVEAAMWKLGSLRANSALELSNAGYDSDIFYGYFIEPINDFTLSAGLPVQIFVPISKTIVLDFFDRPQYLFYLDTKGERAWNNIFKGRVHLTLKNLYFQAAGGLASIRQRMSPELNINIRQKEDSLNGLVLWQTSREVSFAFLYSGMTYDYGDAEIGGTALSVTLNRDEEYVDFVTFIQPNSRVRVFLDGQRSTYTFLDSSSRYKDTRSFGVFGGFDFVPQEEGVRPIAPIQGRISVGYKRFDIIDPAFIDGSGLVGTINVSAGIMKKTTGRAFFSRDFQFSAYSNATFYTSTTYGGGISRFLSRKASISYDFSFGRGSYPMGKSEDEILQSNNLRYTSHLFGLHLRMAKKLGVSFLGTLGKRILDVSGQVRNRNFFGLNLVYGVVGRQISAPISGLSR